MAELLLKRNANFRMLFTGAAAANLGDGIAALALPWLASLISRDPFHIALVAFATRLPWFLLALPAGVITDRASRQVLMLRADLMRMAISAGIVAMVLTAPALPAEEGAGWLIALLALFAFALGAAEVFRDNAAQTALPMLVEKSDLERANGQIWSVEQIMGQFTGPPVAGILIALALPVPFSFNALAFGLAAFCVWAIAFPPRGTTPAREGFWREMKTGFVWIWNAPVILQLALMLGIMNALHLATLTVLVLFAQEVLGLEALGYGVLLTMGAIGGVAGGLICPVVAERLGQRRSLLLALAVMPACFLAIGLSGSVIVTGAALLIEMLAAVLWNVVTVSYRQRVIPEEILGRVNSIYRFFGWGMMPLGALFGGALVSLAAPAMGREAALALPFLVAGGGMILMLSYAWVFLRLGR